MQRKQFSLDMRSRTASAAALTLALLLLASAAAPVIGVARRTQQQQQQGRPAERPRQTDQTNRGTLPPPPPPPRRSAPAPIPTPTPSPVQQSSTQQSDEVADGDDEVINVDTSLINLQVRVVDRQGRPVNDVRREEFRVFEDNVPQEVAFFSTEEVPISYGMAIDTSFSLRSQIDKVIEASKAIVASNKPGDETALIQFQNEAEILQDFTADKTKLEEKLDELYVRAGQTAVRDAVYLATEHVASQRKTGEADRRRRALILVTDGEEKGSQYEQEQLFDFLREQGVQIYVIGFVGDLEKEDGSFIRKSSRDKAVNLLTRLAKETGGRVFFPESITELPKIAEEITRDMRTQFVVGYQPTNKARDGRFRSVRVTIADAPDKSKRIALTRSGYTPGRDGQPAQPAANTPRPTTTPATRPNN